MTPPFVQKFDNFLCKEMPNGAEGES